MNEKPLERLNYYNGRPLDAADLKTEQEYHIRTRRWLNKSLYSAGIARGLEVRPITEGPKKDAPFVAVGPGLALDSEGREIILLEDTPVEVCSYAGDNDSTVVGNYLVIEYAEETIAYEKGGCAVRAEGTSVNQSTTLWGGPSRIQAQVKFSWVPFVPQPGSNQIVLARVELEQPNCDRVYQVDPGARRPVGAASVATVKQYALEGEREVACLPEFDDKTGKLVGQNKVTARIYFHIRGRQPNSVTLYLKADELSRLHYTEMGQHKHSASASGPPATEPAISVDAHSHGHDITTGPDRHQHTLMGQLDEPVDAPAGRNLSPGGYWSIHPGARVDKAGFSRILNLGEFLGMTTEVENSLDDNPPVSGGHRHHISGGINSTVQPPKGSTFHTHVLGGSLTASVENAGVTDSSSINAYSARGGSPLSFFRNLQIAINGVGKTEEIKAQIVDTVAGHKQEWRAGLGDGTGNHPLANKAVEAVPIRLDFLPGATFAEGQHVIEFSVGLGPGDNANGGKILYNLYVE